MNLALFVHLFFHFQRKISELAHQFFLVFYMKLDSLIKVIRPDFCKKVLTVKERPKSPKNGLKMKFLELRQKSNLSMCTFLPEYDITNCLPTFCEI